MEHFSHASHIAADGEVIIKSLQETRPRLELVVEGEPGDIRSTRDCLHAQVFRFIRKELTGGFEDARTCVVGSRLALTHTVGTRCIFRFPCILIIQYV